MPVVNNSNVSCLLSNLPFQHLESNDFIKTSGSWVYQSVDRPTEKLDLYGDIIESPGKDYPLKCSHKNYIESNSCAIEISGRIFYEPAKQNEFSLLHYNTRSLGKIYVFIA